MQVIENHNPVEQEPRPIQSAHARVYSPPDPKNPEPGSYQEVQATAARADEEKKKKRFQDRMADAWAELDPDILAPMASPPRSVTVTITVTVTVTLKPRT